MKLKFLIPLVIFFGMAAFLYKGLSLNPRDVPSVLIDRPMPEWRLGTMVDQSRTISTEDLKGRVWMLNVWATWCVPCKQEHPVFVELKRRGLETPLIGFLYKDKPELAYQYLRREGNPYDEIVFEEKNKVGIDLGVTGVPETFIVDKKGVIRAKFSQPIDPMFWENTVHPLIKKLEAE